MNFYWLGGLFLCGKRKCVPGRPLSFPNGAIHRAVLPMGPRCVCTRSTVCPDSPTHHGRPVPSLNSCGLKRGLHWHTFKSWKSKKENTMISILNVNFESCYCYRVAVCVLVRPHALDVQAAELVVLGVCLEGKKSGNTM